MPQEINVTEAVEKIEKLAEEDKKEKTKVEPEEPELVTVPKGILDDMQKQINELRKGVTMVRPAREKNHTAFIRLVDGSPVMKINKVWTEDRGTVAERNYIEVFDFNDKKIKLDYLQFLNENPKVKVRIDKINEEKKEKVVDYINPSNPNPTFDKGWSSPGEVPMVETYSIFDYDVTILEGDLEGKSFNINSSCLNI
jgi:hypothetical protein